MKVALCLSGHMRTFELTYKSHLENLIKPNQADVFISTWDVVGVGKHNKFDTPQFQEKLNIARVREVYGESLKSFVAFDFNLMQPKLSDFFYIGMTSMFWQIKQANELRKEYEREHGFQYDIVVRARPDLLFHQMATLMPSSESAPIILLRTAGQEVIDDQFAIGGPQAIDLYSSVYDYLEEYKAVEFQPPAGAQSVWWPEQVLKHHLVTRGAIMRGCYFPSELCRDGVKY